MASMARVSGLELMLEWEAADGVTAPELGATWCRLQIRVEGRFVTAVEDTRTDALRRGVYTSAYPLAEWIAEHWWLLRRHVRPSAEARASWSWSHAARRPWLYAHNVRAAGGGLPWPDLTIVPEGAVTRLVWTAGPGLHEQPVAFLTSGEAFLPSDAVTDALAGFVNQVVVRLDDAGIVNTPLQQEWQLIGSSGTEEIKFAEAVARLGLDPFDVPDELADDVIALAEALEPGVLDEFLNSARPDELRRALGWLTQAQQHAQTLARPRLGTPLDWLGDFARSQGAQPWEVGYAAAGAYREQLHLTPPDPFPIADFVAVTSLEASSAGLQGLVVADERSVGLVLPADVGANDASQRFAQARALGLSLLSSRQMLLLDPSHTDLSKASRAFAAELLAPAAGISQYLDVLPAVTGAAFEAIAVRFNVSPLLVQHQYDNQLTS